jgi:hypothetical protein
MAEYIYILIEREFIKTGEPIYKIGKTKQENMKRFKQYPKGSILIEQIMCQNCDIMETDIMNIFKTKYIHRTDIGREYFQGDMKNMIYTIHTIWQTYDAPTMDIEEEPNEIFSIDKWLNLVKKYNVYDFQTTYRKLYEHYIKWSNTKITLQKFISILRKHPSVEYKSSNVTIHVNKI